MRVSLDVIYEDNHLLVVNKPALLPTMGVEAERDSLLQRAKLYVAEKYQKPGNVYLGIVSRLDAPVTGVTLLARTSKAASRLSAAFRDRSVEKIYWALVEGVPESPQGRLEHYLRRDERHRKVHVTHVGAAAAQLAVLEYRTVTSDGKYSLLEIALETGRKHQIRVQLAKIGHAILGDQKYGSTQRFAKGIALHARRLVLDHPTRKERLTLEAALPESWQSQSIVRGEGL